MMRKIKIRLPATLTDFGPSPNSLGLALGLYMTVEISGRDTNDFEVELAGDGANAFSEPLCHPLVVAMSRYFQEIERTKLGISIRVDNQIPMLSGLGAEAALSLAGVMGANNLMGDLYSRNEVLELAARISGPNRTVAALLGGLVTAVLDDDVLVYRRLPVTTFQVVVVVPSVDNFVPVSLPDTIPQDDGLYSMTRTPLLVESLRQGDIRLMANLLDERLMIPRIIEQIPGFGHVREIAQRFGALKVVPCGGGPAVLALIESRHEVLAEEMRLAFKGAGVESRSYVLPVDTQGIVISSVQSA